MINIDTLVSATFCSLALGISAPAFAQLNFELPSDRTLQECPQIGYSAFVINTETADLEQLAQVAQVPLNQVTLCKLAIPDQGFVVGTQIQLTTSFNQEHRPTFQLVRKLKHQGYQAYLSYTSDEPIEG
ncbi:hypothetical protein PN466_08285 [Roseofilum reptotaenium CS-1145]|uniref:Uncharacterized protein n=1 Tax=Roseofilum reptotaenium AO1-A TaxID=1925591 RepID=A0A1L9QLJ0_9CYAN|nr:hypothetical protein [Roseofilum reptotaenium]MDB9516943.1 hypothetical protein [Roseofilum reptotaenium CS-1145]OJJ19757.1 hypothetical protein BI308_21220 [Roseofilum reptotaenium AO1-A]